MFKLYCFKNQKKREIVIFIQQIL